MQNSTNQNDKGTKEPTRAQKDKSINDHDFERKTKTEPEK